MLPVGLQQVLVGHLCIMVDHLQAGVPEHDLQVKNVRAVAQRQDQKCPSQCVRCNIDASPFRDAVEYLDKSISSLTAAFRI